MQNNTEVKPDEFKVGDIVWCVIHGKGVVHAATTSCFSTYPIIVAFENESKKFYSSDGKLDKLYNRTLFFSEPKIDASVTRPFIPTLIGKKVVVTQSGCYPIIIEITWEDRDSFGSGLLKYIKEVCKVYELSSENLLGQ